MKTTYTAITTKGKKILDTKTFATKDEAMNYIMGKVYHTLGNGDGENGGKGSLWNCAADIYKTIAKCDEYGYGYCEYGFKVVENAFHDVFVLMYKFTEDGSHRERMLLDVEPRVMGVYNDLNKARANMNLNAQTMRAVALEAGISEESYAENCIKIIDNDNSVWNLWIEKHTMNLDETWGI